MAMTIEQQRALAMAAARARAQQLQIAAAAVAAPEGIDPQAWAVMTPEQQAVVSGQSMPVQQENQRIGGDNEALRSMLIDKAATELAADVPSAARAVMPAMQGLTYATADEVGSAAAAAAGPNDYATDYEINLRAGRKALDRERKEHPIRSAVTEIAGAVPTLALPGGAAVRGAKGSSMLARGLAATKVAVPEAAAYGYMAGEDGVANRAENAAWAGATAAPLAMGAPYLAAGARKIGNRVLKNRSLREAIRNAPSTAALKEEAGRLYDAGRATGKTAAQTDTSALATSFRNTLQAEGLISPKGRVNSAYPKISGALKLVDDYADGAMTPTQMQAVRKVLKDAAGSNDVAERRVGKMLIDEFDQFTDKFVPDFKQGRAVYQRAKNAEMVDKVTDLAGVRASQYSQSGMENALRTEFRGLDRAQIKGRLRGINDEQADAIRRVARGGALENVLRGAGKAAPTGIIPAGVSGGVPFLVGNTFGGPALGTALAAATMAGGALSRSAATGMQRKNAELARALMALGGAPAARKVDPKTIALIEALIQRGAPVGAPAREQIR